MNLTFRQLRYAVTRGAAGQSFAGRGGAECLAAVDQRRDLANRGALSARPSSSGARLRRYLDRVWALDHRAGRARAGRAARPGAARLGRTRAVRPLVLGCFDELAPYYAPALSRRLRALHPLVELVIEEEDFAGLQRRLADGTIDVALTYELERDPETAAVALLETAPACAAWRRATSWPPSPACRWPSWQNTR